MRKIPLILKELSSQAFSKSKKHEETFISKFNTPTPQNK